MIDNAMYDIRRDEYFDPGNSPAHFYTNSWYSGEPVWTTALKQVYLIKYVTLKSNVSRL